VRKLPRIPIWKRAIDIACCLVALPFLCVITVLMAVGLRLTSPGPILFRQERVGFKGSRFMCYKFRTMAAGADTKSHLMTDELRAYRRIGQRFASHDAVNHGEEEWARKLGDGTKAHTNTVEGFFSILKRGIYGCYFHVSEQHLHRYLAEFDFRYSNRAALGIEDVERTERAIRGIIGKRLTYRTTRGETSQAGTV